MTVRRLWISSGLTSAKNGQIFIESAKDLAGLILDTEASVTDFDMDEDQERLKSLRKPFLSLLAKAQAMVD